MIADIVDSRLDLAKKLGADLVVNTKKGDLAAVVILFIIYFLIYASL